MTTKSINNWELRHTTSDENIGNLEIEHPVIPDEYISFYLLKNDTHIIFGDFCNTGFLESGNKRIDHDFSLDENLAALIDDIENYYSCNYDSISSDFSCNERM
ncbi:hypothetical protein [Photobacterium damselae]|uniref:hypothetical protein n=1 Tax=Photobacterium damselae TaxID=38293 RepID=UPI0040694260